MQEVKNKLLLLLIIGAFIMSGCVSHPHRRPVPEALRWFGNDYHVDIYLRTAVRLQSLGRDEALKRLTELAKADDVHNRKYFNFGNSQIFILCRMLFTARPNREFYSPGIGGFYMFGYGYGYTGWSDWPLAPVELVDGVPFLISDGYVLSGVPQTAEEYLTYCKTNCDWSSFKFAEKSGSQKRAALKKLLASPKWKSPLIDRERDFLSDEIKRFP